MTATALPHRPSRPRPCWALPAGEHCDGLWHWTDADPDTVTACPRRTPPPAA